MSETPSQQRTTPARRKYGRQTIKSAAQKAYASENDVAALETTRHRHAPKTPSKTGDTSTAATEFCSSQPSNSKIKSKTKQRPKNAPASPDPAQQGRQTPPPRSIAIKPGANTAFAGATFHASPAPSALPIPSFLSKSSSESPIALGKDMLQELSPPATDGDVPTPFRPSSAPKTNESPLDFMFRAHREEKERHFRENAQSQSSKPHGSPQSLPWGDVSGVPKPSSLPHPRRTFLRQQSGGIDASELDGTPGRPLGPAFSTPYQERIKAARSASNTNTPRGSSQTGGHLDEAHMEDPTESLKKFLFGDKGSAPGGSFPGTAEAWNPPQNTTGASVVMSPGTKPETKNARANNIEAMENDLRRILKLDMTTGSSSEGRTFSSG